MKKKVLVLGLILVLAIVFVIAVFDWYNGFIIDPPGSAHTILTNFSKATNLQGETVVSENLVLVAGSAYSTKSFALSANLEENCVEIQASDSDAFSVREGRAIQINDLIQTNIYYKCVSGVVIGNDECPLFCTVSFGKEI